MRSGNYGWGSTELNNRGSNGYYWTLRSNNTTSSSYLNFNSSDLDRRNNYNRGYGFAMRCVSLSSRDFGLLSAPLSYVRSGDYAWASTGLNYKGSYGLYWSLRPHNTTYSYNLYFHSSGLHPQSNDIRGYGFATP